MKKHIIPLTSAAIILLMVGCAQIFNNNEIIFPEIAALAVGGLLSTKMPWKTSYTKMFCLITFMAILGIVMVGKVNIDIEFKIMLTLVSAATLLLIFKCSFLPIISAGVLPIIMGTDSIIYPISVAAMTLIIIFVRRIFERYNLRAKPVETECEYNYRAEIFRWIMVLVIFTPISLIALKLNYPFMIAPPLIVAFLEFSYIESPARKSPVAVFAAIAICAFAGAYIRLFCESWLGLPVIITACVSVVAMFVAFAITKKQFPPAGALALLPLIIPANMLFIYPFLVCIGAAIFISCGILIGNITEKVCIRADVQDTI